MKFLISAVFLIVSGALFIGYVNPTYAELKTLIAQQAQYDQALTRSKELQSVRDQLLARYNAFPQDGITRLEKLVPDHVDNVRLILDFDAMASRYGMHVKNVSIESDDSRAKSGQIGPDQSASESVILAFTVSGTYDTYRKFLADLEHSLRIVDLAGLSFGTNDTGVYDYRVRLKTYWLKP
jgi:Tfp pilus assembly protein PilO